MSEANYDWSRLDEGWEFRSVYAGTGCVERGMPPFALRVDGIAAWFATRVGLGLDES